MIELALNNIEKYYGANMVLKDITFDVKTGERLGIVGANGCGKSTLLKIICGLEGYDKGFLSIRKGASIGYLEQMPNFGDDAKVIDVLNTAFKDVDLVYGRMKEVEKELEHINKEDLERELKLYSNLQSKYESLGGYQKEEKLGKVCTGLKLGESIMQRQFEKLSGGEKTTVILGKILIQNPDILLLDEPSNHLDLVSMEWLEEYLKAYKGTVVIVSHDRYFLDNVVGSIVEIEDMESYSYAGNYSAYVKEKERLLQLELEAYINQQKKIKEMEKTIATLKDWGSRGDNNKFFKRAFSMEKMLNRIEKIDKPKLESDSINIMVKSSERSGKEVVNVKSLWKSFGEKEILKGVNLLIRYGERTAFIGENGSGKTTLIKILLGEIEMDRGEAFLGSSVKLGYLPQNITFSDENKTVLDIFREDISITDGKGREYLSNYLFCKEAVFRKVGDLSGGERSRLSLAKLMYNQVNFLILDEPTNHLDIESREELEEFLKDFDGTLLFISHDRYFINSLASRIIELENGQLKSYDGDYEYYKKKKEEIRKADKPVIKSSVPAKKEGQNSVIVPKQTVPDKKKIEEEIDSLEKKLMDLEDAVSKYSCDYKKLEELYNKKKEIQESIEKLMEQYYKIS
jgi:ATP-binding cassette, subfamily F, member 3